MAARTVAEELACHHRRQSITRWILRSTNSPAKLDKQIEEVTE